MLLNIPNRNTQARVLVRAQHNPRRWTIVAAQFIIARKKKKIIEKLNNQKSPLTSVHHLWHIDPKNK